MFFLKFLFHFLDKPGVIAGLAILPNELGIVMATLQSFLHQDDDNDIDVDDDDDDDDYENDDDDDDNDDDDDDVSTVKF